MFAILGEIFFEVLTSPEAFRSTTDYTMLSMRWSRRGRACNG